MYAVGFVVLGPEIYERRNGGLFERVIGWCQLLALCSLIYQSLKMGRSARAVKSQLLVNSPLQQRSRDLKTIYEELGCMFLWLLVFANATMIPEAVATIKRPDDGAKWFYILVGGLQILAALTLCWNAAKLFKTARQC